MFKLINSFRASFAHMNATNHWANFDRADALAQIYKAVYLETNDNLLVKHLVLKGEIEHALGKAQESVESLNRAKELVDKNPKYWEKPYSFDVLKRLKEAQNTNV